MPKITKIENKPEKARVWIFIDDKYCTSIRKRTWQAMNLDIGSEIDCSALKNKENYYWKHAYGPSSWKQERIRIDRVVQWFEKYIPQVSIRVVGFGTDTSEVIYEHPDKQGEPDLSVCVKDTEIEVIGLEVTGTQRKRGDGYWVRPDKIDYVQKHTSRDVWIVLHYREPKECFIWLKPDSSQQYRYHEVNIRGAIEHYVVFDDNSPEIYSSEAFKSYVMKKLN